MGHHSHIFGIPVGLKPATRASKCGSKDVVSSGSRVPPTYGKSPGLKLNCGGLNLSAAKGKQGSNPNSHVRASLQQTNGTTRVYRVCFIGRLRSARLLVI